MKFTSCVSQLRHRAPLHAIVVALPALLFATPSLAAYNVTISSSSVTSNGTLSGGVFTPTGNNAILNVTDLQNALATSSVSVTTGSGGSQTGDITVANKTVWSAHTLTLDAFHSVVLNKALKASSTGGLVIITNDGGSGGDFVIATGKVTFDNTSETLTINGASFTLVADIPSLATDISGNSSGNFALIDNYDASVLPTFTQAPVQTTYSGTFEGLGNKITNLKIIDSTSNDESGLFKTIASGGAVKDIMLASVYFSVQGGNAHGAPLVGINNGLISNCAVTGEAHQAHALSIAGLVDQNTSSGTIKNCHSTVPVDGSGTAEIAGLVAINAGAISNCYATGTIDDIVGAYAGGLVANMTGGSISLCYATGDVTGGHTGGLVGQNAGSITKSFATGSVFGAGSGGGLVGQNTGVVDNTYALGAVHANGRAGSVIGLDSSPASVNASYGAGAVTGASGIPIGGFIGVDNFVGGISNSYWDTDTTGITNLSQGAGNVANDTGITGLSDTTLKSGLPSGFSGSVWAISGTVNGGLPYLIDLPPP